MPNDFFVQWGPAGIILGVLVVIVKWLMSHIDLLTKYNKELVIGFQQFVSEKMAESATAQAETRTALAELASIIRDCQLRTGKFKD